MIIYFTDLDRTLVYSNKFLSLENEIEPVKMSKDKVYPCFMTKLAYDKLKELNERDDIIIIPTTTRSVGEFSTLNYFDTSKYAIVNNGATILCENNIDMNWQSKIKNIINGYDYHFNSLTNNLYSKEFIQKPRIIDGYFLVGLINNQKECRRLLEDIIDPKLFYFTIQGKKFYVFPKEIRKENAMRYLINEIVKDSFDFDVIVSGDGETDIGMFQWASLPSYIVIHEDSKQILNLSTMDLQKPDVLRVIKDEGIESAEYILNDIEKTLNERRNY